MKSIKNKKIWITASFVCIILGMIVLATGRAMGGVPGFYINNSGIHYAGEAVSASSVDPVRDSRELKPFDRMEIAIDYADVEVVASDRFAIDYYVSDEPVCEVRNGKLIFKEADRKPGSFQFTFFNIGFFSENLGVAVDETRYYVRIELPADKKLTEASIDIDSGFLDISALQADTLNIVNEYGDVSLDQYDGKKLDLYIDSGSLFIGSLNAAQAKLENEYGDVEISKASGERLTINMDSCNCQIGQMDYSDVTITDEYGDVSLGLPGKITDYGMDLYTEYGDIRIENERLGYGSDDELTYRIAGNGQKKISVSCDTGNIEVYSTK